MFILSDGKHYVMENPMRVGEYLKTTSPVQAKKFTYKQARSLLQNKKKSIGWIRDFQMINDDSGKVETEIPRYSNEGVFCDDKSFEFDESVVTDIKHEAEAIINLAAWDVNQLNTYSSILTQGLQYYDSAISDVRHARLDKRPPAHIMTKIDRILNELEEKRRDIKQTRNYIDVMNKAIMEHWTIGKIKTELSKMKYVPYKGRTPYYAMVEELLKEY